MTDKSKNLYFRSISEALARKIRVQAAQRGQTLGQWLADAAECMERQKDE